MKASLITEDLEVFETNEVSFWAIDPQDGDGELTIAASVRDNDGNEYQIDFTLDFGDLMSMEYEIFDFASRGEQR